MTTLELDDDQALVLYERLARLDEADAFSRCAEPAEEVVLWALHGQLESRLTAPFEPHYLDRVRTAQARLLERYGTPIRPPRVPPDR
jgi:hypothetical protein